MDQEGYEYEPEKPDLPSWVEQKWGWRALEPGALDEKCRAGVCMPRAGCWSRAHCNVAQLCSCGLCCPAAAAEERRILGIPMTARRRMGRGGGGYAMVWPPVHAGKEQQRQQQQQQHECR